MIKQVSTNVSCVVELCNGKRYLRLEAGDYYEIGHNTIKQASFTLGKNLEKLYKEYRADGQTRPRSTGSNSGARNKG